MLTGSREITSDNAVSTFDRKVDAERWLVEVQFEVSRGTYIDPKAGQISFADYAEQWMTDLPSKNKPPHNVNVLNRWLADEMNRSARSKR